jgi:alpha-D-xyloside xylohydrolase
MELYCRWAAFGLLSSHSRLHGSSSYRVPWQWDSEVPVDVLRKFTKLKHRLMPYLWTKAVEAHETGVPVMRPMWMEFTDDPACAYLDRQYMLGDSLLVAPVFSDEGDVEYYVPTGRWTKLLTGEVVEGPRWVHERHDLDSIPLLVRPDTLLPLGTRDDRPDYDYLSEVEAIKFGEPKHDVLISGQKGESKSISGAEAEPSWPLTGAAV